MMQNHNFAAVFEIATKHRQPHEYQVRLACGERNNVMESEWLQRGTSCTSRLISVPTGMGKTAAVTLAWLWNRILRGDDSWPRRLIYCLPMRTLVEQTRDEIKQWLNRLAATHPDNTELAWLAAHSPVILMGGEENDTARREWDIYPEKPAIIIGTQDMLLSRALNRGYGMARARWPMHFALLNNDCLWVMDETQLMDVGLATSAQLQSFRETNTHTWWMSATMQPEWLRSPETSFMLPALIEGTVTSAVSQDITKALKLVDVTDEKGIAALAEVTINSLWQTTTLVIVNTVKRAIAVYDALKKDKSLEQAADIYLAHSRFRPADRQQWRSTFLSRHVAASRPRIIVATQVVEAGVDISADTLITEIAPWTSLIQRFGRAARYGGTAEVVVIDLDEKSAPPYDYAEIEAAREELQQLEDVSIASLMRHDLALTPERRSALYPYAPPFLLLQQEVTELFDTSPDLSGADIDISRFIRTGPERDCQLAWIAGTPDSDYHPSATELCSVPIGDMIKFIKRCKSPVWRWDYLDRAWIRVPFDQVYPGLVLVASDSDGGYTPERGFDGVAKKPVPLAETLPVPASSAADSAEEDESLSESAWQTITEHGAAVSRMLLSFGLNLPAFETLTYAALWHDLGKAHAAFQSLIKNPPSCDIAKAPPEAWHKPPAYMAGEADPRPGFRHELASMLALLDLRNSQKLLHDMSQDEFDLLLYLVAAHHGKVRASIQASPHDQKHSVAKEGDAMPIRGILDGDTISGTPFGVPDMTLSLDPAAIGWSLKTGASWSERVGKLLETHNPFALAYLETILRAADIRASQKGAVQ